MTGDESFLGKELKFLRRWLYSQGLTHPEEDRNPVDVQMESFFSVAAPATAPRRIWRRACGMQRR